jgi:methionyl-tRNA formyltransferase
MRWTFLNLAEHPRGRAMLAALLDAGFTPSCVIEEESTLAAKSLVFFEREMPGGHPPTTAELLRGRDVPRIAVANHNDAAAAAALRAAGPDLIILGDTRIIGAELRAIPHTGTINVHPGWLPDVRGNNPYVWALLHDLPLGCTAHYIDGAIDTGPVLARRSIAVEGPMLFAELLRTINALCAELIVEVLRAHERGSARPEPQQGKATTFTKAAAEQLEAARRKLEAGHYRSPPTA